MPGGRKIAHVWEAQLPNFADPVRFKFLRPVVNDDDPCAGLCLSLFFSRLSPLSSLVYICISAGLGKPYIYADDKIVDVAQASGGRLHFPENRRDNASVLLFASFRRAILLLLRFIGCSYTFASHPEKRPAGTYEGERE